MRDPIVGEVRSTGWNIRAISEMICLQSVLAFVLFRVLPATKSFDLVREELSR